tara:strand:- start:8434 stop:8832 length:399 start_codon:yes stop_codon:yes gene_type:complete
MDNPGVRIEVEEDVVEPVLDMIATAIDDPADVYPEEHIDSDGRMFDYGHQKSDSQEGRMSKAKLFRMGKMAQSLHDRLQDGDDLPGWVQDKITTAEDRLESAYDYMDYKIHRSDQEESPCNGSIALSLDEIA